MKSDWDNTEIESNEPLKRMASGLTLRELFAKDAPDVPDWFLQQEIKFDETKNYGRDYIFLNEEMYFRWRLYYAYKMIELLK